MFSMMETLNERFAKLGARFFERDGATLVRDFGDVANDYAALREAGVAYLPPFGVLRVEGADRIAWLHKLVTPNVQAIAPGNGAYGLLLNAKGHIAADFVVLVLNDALLLYTSASAKTKLARDLQRAIFREKVTLTDVSDAYAVFTLQGANAPGALHQTLGGMFQLAPYQFFAMKFFDQELIVVQNPRAGFGGYDLLVPREHAEIFYDLVTARTAAPIGFDALNVARIEAGVAWFGDDFDETMLAPEARLDAFIAENKGCYTGQEVIARIKNRGHVNRLLVRMQIEGETVPERGDLIFAEDKEIGWVTSAVWSFEREAPLAFGYTRREIAQDGARVQVARGEGRLNATVVMSE
ncbi:MAG: aminomethyl transferase family protein [Chloroflexi bacterium]|nr:aminomethyl transferase family protein [Chloroflexota bacterium]